MRSTPSRPATGRSGPGRCGKRSKSEGDQGTLGLYTAADDQWTIARLTDAGRATDGRSRRRSLGRLAGPGREHPAPPGHRYAARRTQICPRPKYVRDIEEVVRGLKEGDDAGRDATGQAGTGGRFELAALVMPATVEHIRAISSHGERMPAKSTYFYPKLLSGLVINPLE